MNKFNSYGYYYKQNEISYWDYSLNKENRENKSSDRRMEVQLPALLEIMSGRPTARLTNMRYWPDPDLTSQDKPDPDQDPLFFQYQTWIQTPLSWKFSIYFMMSFNKKLFPF